MTLTMSDERKIRKLLELLSPLEPQKRHQDVRSTRLENTGTWLLQHHQFQQWLEYDAVGKTHSRRAFCCYGFPGAGKTVMRYAFSCAHIEPLLVFPLTIPTSSIVIDHLTSKFAQQDKVAITCLYCDYRDQEDQILVNLLGSLLKQLLTAGSVLQVPGGVRSTLEEIQNKRRNVDTADVLSMVKLTLPRFRRSFVCIDALDELQPDVRKALLKALCEEFMGYKAVQLFLTGRPHIAPEVNESLRISQYSIDIIANGDDIRAYLNSQIALDISPTAMNKSLKEEILQTIVEKSQGM